MWYFYIFAYIDKNYCKLKQEKHISTNITLEQLICACILPGTKESSENYCPRKILSNYVLYEDSNFQYFPRYISLSISIYHCALACYKPNKTFMIIQYSSGINVPDIIPNSEALCSSPKYT